MSISDFTAVQNIQVYQFFFKINSTPKAISMHGK